jgi:REP element-mobilizing transposase RayT
MPHARKDNVTWLSGHYYHLYNRGARRITIFREEKNYHFVLFRIKHYCAALDLSLIAYCLMPNHYHFLIRQNGEQPAGLLPQRVFNSYSKAYNVLYGHSGTLFERRYQANHVDNDVYLRHLCQYIHANPVKDGIVAQLEAWPFSNFLEWVGLRRGTLVNHEFVAIYFGGPERYRLSLYEFVRARAYLGLEFRDLEVRAR